MRHPRARPATKPKEEEAGPAGRRQPTLNRGWRSRGRVGACPEPVEGARPMASAARCGGRRRACGRRNGSARLNVAPTDSEAVAQFHHDELPSRTDITNRPLPPDGLLNIAERYTIVRDVSVLNCRYCVCFVRVYGAGSKRSVLKWRTHAHRLSVRHASRIPHDPIETRIDLPRLLPELPPGRRAAVREQNEMIRMKVSARQARRELSRIDHKTCQRGIEN